MSAPVRRLRTGALELDEGSVLADVEQAYTLEGTLAPGRDNLVVVLHALTGGPRPGAWWPGIVGPGAPLDTRRWAVLCPSLLGSPYGTTRPPPETRVTPRDMARLVRRLVTALGVVRPRLVTGGSLGGMVALEWVAADPEACEAAVVFAAPAVQSADAVGHGHVQRRALDVGGPDGLALARMAAMLTYRTGREFDRRFGRRRRDDGRFEMQSYLEHQGRRFVERFDERAYRTLLDAMDDHDVGRDRGGVARALGRYRGELVGVGIPGDRLYPARTVRAWTDAVGARYVAIESRRGHDGFLVETDQVGGILQAAVGRRRCRRPEPEGAR